MTDVGRRLRSERGLVGKAIVFALVLMVLLGVAAVDTGSILFTKFKVDDTAQQASFDAAVTYRNTKDRQQAYESALATVEDQSPGARITTFDVNRQTGAVTLTVTKKASTLAVRYIGFLKHFQRVEATETSLPRP